MRAALVLLLSIPAVAHPPDAGEEASIVREIVAACPQKKALAERASADFHDPARAPAALAAYEKLLACAGKLSIVHIRVGYLKFASGDFAAGEAHYRTAVKLDPTFTNKLSLLEALVRQNKPEADALYAELARYDGDRDDIWAGLAYAAFHREDDALMRKASAKAIALDTKWWQAWFCAAAAEGVAEKPDYARALRWLDKADSLGAPAKYTRPIRDALTEAARKR
jgi:tetratricopeptide (TPR) repeat protein